MTCGDYWITTIQAIFLSVNLKSFSILFNQNHKTIKKFVKRLNEEAKEKYFSNLAIIGGENVIVEADESKFGKRKHHRGHYVEGVWVLGMVERTIERRIVLIPVIRRDRETLKFLLEFHIRRGSMLITDGWRGYRGMEENYLRQVVNHSEHFVDPITRAHTNTIEGNWSALKAGIEKRSRTIKKIWLPLFAAMEKRNCSIKTFIINLL